MRGRYRAVPLQAMAQAPSPPTESVFVRAQQMVTAGQDSAGRAVVDSVLRSDRRRHAALCRGAVLARDAQQDGRRGRAGLSTDRRRVSTVASSRRKHCSGSRSSK